MTPSEEKTAEERLACAHLKVEYRTSVLPKTGATIGWWQCALCPTLFITSPELGSLRLTNQLLEAEVERMKIVLLPMAKGYAAEHPVGNNQQMVQEIESRLRELESQNGKER